MFKTQSTWGGGRHLIFKISFKDGDLRTNEKQSKEVLNEALLTFSSLRLLTGCVISPYPCSSIYQPPRVYYKGSKTQDGALAPTSQI